MSMEVSQENHACVRVVGGQVYTSENKEQSRKVAKPEAEVKPGTNIYTGHDKSHG
jgi:hypothetical protein